MKTKTEVQNRTAIRPLGDRILVQRDDAKNTTAGGIILPEKAKDKPREGTVLAVGTGYVFSTGEVRPLLVKPGDRVLFSLYAGSEVTNLGEDHVIMREGDVLGILS